ncbi:MAG: hypothetical protein KAX49_15955 [Halanaerobiales bacterium]|nr:hypothetical protein [Halanaerobiales bacterium]
MTDHKNKWFTLDNAGKLYPSIMSPRVTTFFRVSVTLVDNVNPDLLQKALNKIIIRFPYFQVHLKRGVFWYYFEQTDKSPSIEKETYYPCMSIQKKNKNFFSFRVLYFQKKISVEFSHSLTDGTGAMTFLKSLVIEYFRLNGIIVNESDEFSKWDYEPDQEEYEDAYKKYYNNRIPTPPKKNKAYHFPFPLEDKRVYHIITGIIPVKDILAKAKEYGFTLTEFLIALYFETILDFLYSLPPQKQRRVMKPIILNVPVNLRKIYPSKTMRNFFISITPEIDPRLGEYTFKELLKYVHHFMQIEVDKKYINQRIAKNVNSEMSLLTRLFPLILKDLILVLFYSNSSRGENCYTSSLSNMGKITMPHELNDHIERFEAYPPPSTGNKIKMASISFKEHLYLSFGNLTKENEIERIFFRKLIKMNIPVKIETNKK